MIKITPFKKQHQTEVDLLMKEIADEFSEPISSPNSSPEIRTIDKYWVATKEDQVIGTIGLIKIENRRVVLKKMFVKKEVRGKGNGVSSLLLQTAINWCREENITNVFLGTMNQFKAAQKFYEKNDFHQLDKATLPIDFPHNFMDDIFYKRHLPMDDLHYRVGNINDLKQMMDLAYKSWKGYKDALTVDNWNTLNNLLTNSNTFVDLVYNSHCILCENRKQEVIGMAFLVPHGHPTEIYQKDWSYIRYVSVDPEFGGQGIGKTLTEKCIKFAKENNEKIVALHTSEMMGKAISIYENLGFEILRELEPRLGKRYWLYLLKL